MNLHLISVIMPVYNAEQYVGEAIESILNQTFIDFEFLIFNDGSTDNSAEIVQHYADKDKRIIFYNYTENTGYLKHLNEGIDKAKGKYIARMDADDISLPQRFDKQVQFMEENTEVILLGTGYKAFPNQDFVWLPQEKDADIRVQLLQECAFAHPTVLIRTSVLKNNRLYYNQVYYPAEDYHFWVMLSSYGKMANLTEILLLYRIHEKQISNIQSLVQQENTKKIQLLQFSRLDIENKPDLLLDYISNFSNITLTAKMVCQLAELLKDMYKTNEQKKLYQTDIWYSFLQKKWSTIVRKTLINYNFKLLIAYTSSPFPTFSLLTTKQKLLFIIKCLIHWKTRI